MKKILISASFYVLPIITISYFVNIMLSDKWNNNQPQNLICLIQLFLIATVINWFISRVATSKITNETSDTEDSIKKENLSGFANIIGIIFVIFTAYNYTPDYKMIASISLLFLFQITITVLKMKEVTKALSSIILIIILGIIVQIHPSCNYEVYSEKVNSAINLTYPPHQQYYAAIDSFNLLLEDKYFVNNYSKNLAKLVLAEKNNSTEIITNIPKRGIRPSVSISSPRKYDDKYEYTVSFASNKGNSFGEEHIVLNDFTATIHIDNMDENKSIVTLSNIKGSSGKKSIYILSGAVKNSEQESSYTTPRSESFLYINPFERVATVTFLILFLLMPLYFIKKVRGMI